MSGAPAGFYDCHGARCWLGMVALLSECGVSSNSPLHDDSTGAGYFIPPRTYPRTSMSCSRLV